MMRILEPALVLFSGGQDSTTCLAWALSRFSRVDTVGFTYSQRHAAELDARPRIITGLRERFPEWSATLGEDHILPMDTLAAIGGSALLAGAAEISPALAASALPATFVPGRNLLFLAAAAALAWRCGIRRLVGGMCETDYSGYPDCRDETIKALGHALDLGMDAHFTIHTPLMHIDKAASWALAHSLGGRVLVDLIIEETVTCYEGDRTHRHAWGYGCGRCAACELRAHGFERYIAA